MMKRLQSDDLCWSIALIRTHQRLVGRVERPLPCYDLPWGLNPPHAALGHTGVDLALKAGRDCCFE